MAQMLVLGYPATTGAVNLMYVDLRKALLNNGWTEHDIISSTPGARDIVFKSTPLDATAGNACFLRITQTGSTNLWWHVYMDWDTTTHAGINDAAPASAAALLDTTFLTVARVNPYAVALYFRFTNSRTNAYAGYVRRGLPASKAGFTKTSVSTLAGATTVGVVSDMTGKLKVGQRVMIYNYAHSSASANAANAEVAYIQTITAGTIAFTGPLTKNYDAGAIIGQNPMPIVSTFTNENSGGSAIYLTYYMPIALDGVRVGPQSHTAVAIQVQPATESNIDPGDIYLDYGIGLIGVSSNETSKTGWLGHLYHWECCAALTAGVLQIGDDINDGSHSYLVMSYNSTSDAFLMGPRA